jgi:hypothetical protein
MITKLITRPGALLLVAALVSGCRDQAVPIVEPTRYSAASASLDVALDGTATTQAAIEDAIDRVLPALSDQPDAQQLAPSLHGVGEALSNGNAADALGLARAAGAAVDRYARFHPDDDADLDAIRLALALLVGGE